MNSLNDDIKRLNKLIREGAGVHHITALIKKIKDEKQCNENELVLVDLVDKLLTDVIMAYSQIEKKKTDSKLKFVNK